MKTPSLLFAAFLLVGCGTTSITRYGEVKLKQSKRITAFDVWGVGPTVVWNLEFPPVSLSEAGKRRFTILGMHKGIIPSNVTLRYPYLSHPLTERDMFEQWGDAKFRLTLTNVTSEASFSHVFSLAQTNWNHDATISSSPHFTLSLYDSRFHNSFNKASWQEVCDYDVEIDVLVPTRSGSHALVLSGGASTFTENH